MEVFIYGFLPTPSLVEKLYYVGFRYAQPNLQTLQ